MHLNQLIAYQIETLLSTGNPSRTKQINVEKDQYITEYDNKVLQLSAFTDAVLKEKSFTETQIYAIRNYEKNDKMRAAASESYRTSTYLSSYNYNAAYNRTEVRVGMELVFVGGNISGGNTYQTGIALKGSGADFIMQPSLTYNRVNYKYLATGTSFSVNTTLKIYLGLAVRSEFSGMSGTAFAQNSLTIYTGYADGHVRNFGISSGVALRGLVWSGTGLSFSSSGSIGISVSFTWGWIDIWKYYASYSR